MSKKIKIIIIILVIYLIAMIVSIITMNIISKTEVSLSTKEVTTHGVLISNKYVKSRQDNLHEKDKQNISKYSIAKGSDGFFYMVFPSGYISTLNRYKNIKECKKRTQEFVNYIIEKNKMLTFTTVDTNE